MTKPIYVKNDDSDIIAWQHNTDQTSVLAAKDRTKYHEQFFTIPLVRRSCVKHDYHFFGDYPIRRCNFCSRPELVELTLSEFHAALSEAFSQRECETALEDHKYDVDLAIAFLTRERSVGPPNPSLAEISLVQWLKYETSASPLECLRALRRCNQNHVLAARMLRGESLLNLPNKEA